MKVFVTGGSGFVGGHVIESLAAEHEVVGMARSERSAAVVAERGGVAVHCSLDDVGPEHLEGVDVVVHAAAYVEEWGPYEAFHQANVVGTERLLEAAQVAGVGRFVLISTNATVHDGLGQRGVDESAPVPPHRRFPYGATKALAERAVLAANREGFTTLALRPCFVWGPRDNSVLPALVRMVEEGNFLWLDGGRAKVSTTHIDNLVHAVRLGLAGGVGGRAYFVADDGDTTVRHFLEGLGASAGLDLPGRSLPAAPVRWLATGIEGVWRTFGLQTTPPITRMAVVLMSADMTVVSDRARAELGWAPVIGFDQGMERLSASA